MVYPESVPPYFGHTVLENFKNLLNPLSAECQVYLTWKFDIFIVLDPEKGT